MAIKNWWGGLTLFQKCWIIGATIAICLLGIISGDTWVNVLIGTIGIAYVSVYSTGARGAFLMGVAYVGLYTIICLQNRIMLDAVQNIVLIPLYIISYIYWGQKRIKPKNLNQKQTIIIFITAIVAFVALFGLSKLLHGNYSILDAITTTSTMYAMILGLFGISFSWWFWTINNSVSAVIFGLALSTPTGSFAVFVMKMVFLVNGIIGFISWAKNGRDKS